MTEKNCHSQWDGMALSAPFSHLSRWLRSGGAGPRPPDRPGHAGLSPADDRDRVNVSGRGNVLLQFTLLTFSSSCLICCFTSDSCWPTAYRKHMMRMTIPTRNRVPRPVSHRPHLCVCVGHHHGYGQDQLLERALIRSVNLVEPKEDVVRGMLSLRRPFEASLLRRGGWKGCK